MSSESPSGRLDSPPKIALVVDPTPEVGAMLSGVPASNNWDIVAVPDNPAALHLHFHSRKR